MKKVVVIGAGINGLVAANYLKKENYDVTLLEFKEHTGGACIKDSKVINDKKIDFAYGATVLGMMPKFIFEETGLSKNITTYCPDIPKLVYFKDDENPTKIHRNPELLENELKNQWNENGNVKGFRRDENLVIDYIRNLYVNGKTPSIENAYKILGKEITELWIRGSAKNLLDHYFTSEKTKVYMGMTVIESSPASYNEKGTAFTIPLMDSGSIFNGYWGFVKGGIWKITEELTKINHNLGVNILLNCNIQSIDTESGVIHSIINNKDHSTPFDKIIFCTDPKTPLKFLDNSSNLKEKDYRGSSGKLTLFFEKPVVWKKESSLESSFRFIFQENSIDSLNSSSQNSIDSNKDYYPGYIQIYPDGAAQRNMGNIENFDKIICFTKSLSFEKRSENYNDVIQNITNELENHILNMDDIVDNKFLAPKDLKDIFFFPEGNIDHLSMRGFQNFDQRTFSSNPYNNFYNFLDYENIYYGGSGIFPCGSVGGTAGYMATKNVLKDE